MQQTIEKQHRWTDEELSYIYNNFEHTKKSIHAIVEHINSRLPEGSCPVTFFAVKNQVRGLVRSEMRIFDYSNPKPLKMLFSRCTMCGGTTTVNETAYCRSCLSTWNAITLQPMTYVDSAGKVHGLHEPDRI